MEELLLSSIKCMWH